MGFSVVTLVLLVASFTISAATTPTEDIEESINDLVQDVTLKFSGIEPENFWHPYVYGTGNEHRESIQLQKVEFRKFEGSYLQWKHARLGLKHYLVGMQPYTITIFSLEFKQIASIDTSETLVALEVFTRWNDKYNHADLVILAATDTNRLHVYELEDDTIEEVGRFPFEYNVAEIQISRVRLSVKIILIPKDSKHFIDIYNIEGSGAKTHIWFFQRLLVSHPLQVVAYDSDVHDSVIVVASPKKVLFYAFNSKAGMYSSLQEAELGECRKLFSFSIAYRHYVGCVPADAEGNSEGSRVKFAVYDYNKNSYEIASFLTHVDALDVFPVAAADYREEHFLIAIGLDYKMKIYLDGGKQDGFQLAESCEDNETEKCPDMYDVDLKHGVGFQLGEYTAYIFPAKNTGSETHTSYLRIKTDVLDWVSPVVEQSALLYETFHGIAEKFNRWETGIREVENALKRSVQLDKPNIISGDWNLKELQTTELKVTREYVDSSSPAVDDIFGTFTFMGQIWTTDDFNAPPSLINLQLQTLRNDLIAAERLLNDALKLNSPEIQVITGNIYTTGEIDAEYLSANIVSVETIQDYKTPQEIFDNYVLKSHYSLIQSPLVFEDIVVTNLVATYLQNVLIQDIAVKTQENHFRCQTALNGPVTFYGNVGVSRVNGKVLKDEVIFANNISGCNFTDGFIVTNNTKTSGEYDFDNILLRSSSQKVTATYHFSTLNIVSDSNVGQLMDQDFSEFVDSIITSDYSGKITGRKEIQGKITANELQIGRWNGLKFPDDFVSAHSHTLYLNGSKQFSKIEAKEVKIGHLLDELEMDSIVSREYPMEITGKWTFEGEVTIDKDIEVVGLVDGVDLDHFTLKDSLDEKKESFVINGDVEFESKVTFEYLNIRDLINDLSYEEAFERLIVFKGSICEIPGETTILSNLSVDNLTITDGEINGIPLDSIMKTYGDQNITGQITFTKDIRFNKLYALGQYNEIDLQEVALNGIYLNELQDHDIEFAEIVCAHNKRLVVNGPVNGVEDYPSQVGLISGRQFQEFLGPVTFQKLVLTNLDVENSITQPYSGVIGGMDVMQWMKDRISLSEDEELEYKLKVDGKIKISKDLKIDALNGVQFQYLLEYSLRKDLRNIKFSESMKIKSLSVKNGSINFFDELSGYNLDTIYNNAIPLNSENTIVLEGDWHFQSVILDGPIHVRNEFCGVDLQRFSADAVRQNDVDVHFGGQQRFSYVQALESLETPVINNVPFENILMIDYEGHSIGCHMKFYGDVTILGDLLLTEGHINNVSLNELASYYSKNDHVHEIGGNLELDYIDVVTLQVDGSLNDKHIEEYLSKLIKIDDIGLVFTGTKTFTGNVVIRNHVNTYFYNSIDMRDTDILRLDDNVHLPEVHFSRIAITDSVHVTGGVDASTITHVDWEDLVTNSIPLISDSAYPERRNLRFDHIRVKSLTNLQFIQYYRFEDLIPLNSDQTISRLKIKKMVFTGQNMEVSGLVLGHDLYEEYRDTLMKESDESYDLYGKKHFNGTVTVLEDITCFGPTFKNDVVDITNEFYLLSPVVFDQPIYVDGDVKVTEPVDGYTVESIMSEALTQEDDQIITGEWDFQQGITFQEDVNGEGDFEDFDIQKLIDHTNYEIAEVQERIGKAKQTYQDLCYSVVNATQEFSYSPVKLDAFDSHQTILLEKQVERTITVTAHGRLFLFTSSSSCEVVKYEMKADPELFYQSVESKDTRLLLGPVHEWHSGELGDFGILVFYTFASDCSHLTTGVYAAYLKEGGGFSQVASLHNGTVLSFTVTSDLDYIRSAAVILDTSSHLKIILWDQHGQLSPATVGFEVDGSYDSVQSVLLNDKTIRILLTSKHEFSLYDYHWTTKSLTFVARQNYESFGTIRNIFQSFGASYAVLQSSDSQLSSLKSPCTLQVFKVLDDSVNRYHQLSIQGLVSSTVFEFSHQPYLALLSKSHGLQIHKFMGLNGLQRMNPNPIKVFNGLEVRSFEYRPWSFSVARPFITVLTANTLEIYHSVTYGDSLDVNYNSLCTVY